MTALDVVILATMVGLAGLFVWWIADIRHHRGRWQ